MSEIADARGIGPGASVSASPRLRGERPRAWETHRLALHQLFGEIPHQFALALGRAMERWVERQIATHPALRHMCVLGPSKVARIETIKEARARPYHAALAVAVHRQEATPKMCRAALRALSELSDDHVPDYIRMVLTAAPRELGRELSMGVEARELKITAVEREGYLYNKAFGCGLRAGSRRGRERGLEQGLVTAVGDLLEARGLGPTDELLARLGESKDHTLLRRAVVLAGTAASIDELVAALRPTGKVSRPRRKPTRSRRRSSSS